MADKVYVTLVLKVDLNCCRCRKKIQEYLCFIQHQESIVGIVFDDKKNEVRILGPFNCPEQLKGKLLCKFPKIIKCIEIIPPKKEEPKKEEPKKEEPKKEEPKKEDPLKEKFMRRCMDEYDEVKKCIDKCKAECEDKCWEMFKCKCKNKCKCECKCKEEKPKEEPKKDPPKKEEPKKEEPKKEDPPKPAPAKPPPCRPEFGVCCARPCPCFVAWTNNFQCCTCGMVCWPQWSGPGWGHGPGVARPMPWGCEPSRPQRSCDPYQPHNIVFESSPNCSIM